VKASVIAVTLAAYVLLAVEIWGSLSFLVASILVAALVIQALTLVAVVLVRLRILR